MKGKKMASTTYIPILEIDNGKLIPFHIMGAYSRRDKAQDVAETWIRAEIAKKGKKAEDLTRNSNNVYVHSPEGGLKYWVTIWKETIR